ncbi:TonB-dependent receptor [Polymorphobacter megasporae]|uniref:TonB-dependent receptor n=1 Tax=Glacieibacterium megasporae TaxID=2835787 RepID=UPI001C1E780A|nr:TonB-dependent receptor [Polymorphobacter megasporae]UAJ12468.1 TonB-dependent receptor [Polymorphobacter megasporae]
MQPDSNAQYHKRVGARVHRFTTTVVALTMLLAGTPTLGKLSDFKTRIDIGRIALPIALAKLAKETGCEVLFDEATLSGLTASAVHGRLTIGSALARMLTGTGIGVRLTEDNVYVLVPAAETLAAQSDGAIAEILVVGRRTGNADIRRTANDIQPYDVITVREIVSAHEDNVDDVLRARLPQNTQNLSAMQDPTTNAASPRSEINLRGLGANQTLVLVDGRRLPGLPSASNALAQPDVNAIPVGAIERIETLSSTAGGIYGPGATGGVVNVVLRHDYRGAELNVTGGITARGDAPRLRVEGRIGFTPDNGRTDVMLFVSHTESGDLLTGDRNYQAAARAMAFRNNAASYLSLRPVGNAINVFSADGTGEQAKLTLDAGLGGASLGAQVTFLPLNTSGTPADRAATLVANAGKVATNLANDNSGARGDILTRPSTTSGILSVRHSFGPIFEGFVDALYLHDEGTAIEPVSSVSEPIAANAPNNPFAESIIVTYPLPVVPAVAANAIESVRITAGLIAQLPFSWRASAEGSWASSHVALTVRSVGQSFNFADALASGEPGADGQPALDPLGNWPAFFAELPASLTATTLRSARTNRSTDATIRLAGPAFHLAGGPLTLTLLGETRTESVAQSVTTFTSAALTVANPSPDIRQRVMSGYGELRAPLIASTTNSVFRGFELQLALRYDKFRTTIPADFTFDTQPLDARITARAQTLLYTAGLRFFPISRVMLRGSFAIGNLPPSVDQIASRLNNFDYAALGLGDPKRGGRAIGSEGAFDEVSGGSAQLAPERARTISLGLVVDPFDTGPRLSIDLTQIRKTNEISFVHAYDPAYFVAHEASYPARIVRALLTAADAAQGFSGGTITRIDTTALNGGRTLVEAVDLQFDWRLPARVGTVSITAKTTWQPVLKRQLAQDTSTINTVGSRDGPLEWRGYAGLNWETKSWALGATAQYLGRYNVASSNPNLSRSNVTIVTYQGSPTIPAQVYIDLEASLKLASPRYLEISEPIEFRLGIENIFDHSPPSVINPATAGYSYYGDPRRRRINLTVSTHF